MYGFVVIVSAVMVVGCGEPDDPPLNPDPVDDPVGAESTDAAGGTDVTSPDADGLLVGTWDAVRDQNGELPPRTLVFTYQADGTGTVVEEETSTKGFSWTYDADAKTLHIETTNEDLLFTATFEGDTLTLESEAPATMIVMRRIDGAGE
ncbi:MAG: hypothetical protein ACIAXF_13670 [Phycisphaerales bacterium JB063]